MIKDVTNMSSLGILKSQSEEPPSTNTKKLHSMRTRSSPHVHFSSDPVSCVLEIPRVSVYPPLIPNKDSLSCITPFLSPLGVKVEAFLEDLKSRNVEEVGQLADMDAASVQELKGLEVRGRKVKVVKRALKHYHRHLVKPKQNRTLQEKQIFKVKWRKLDSAHSLYNTAPKVKVNQNAAGQEKFGEFRNWSKIDPSRHSLKPKGDLKNGKSKDVPKLGNDTFKKSCQASNYFGEDFFKYVSNLPTEPFELKESRVKIVTGSKENARNNKSDNNEDCDVHFDNKENKKDKSSLMISPLGLNR